MKQYLDMLQDIIDLGERRSNRTGVDTIGIFGYQNRYNLQQGFPAVTTKKLWFKGVVHELLWFLSGDTNIGYLVKNGVNIWNDDAYRHYLDTHDVPRNLKYMKPRFVKSPLSKDGFINEIKSGNPRLGDLGPVYGKQWTDWNGDSIGVPGINQLSSLIHQIKTNPESRRLILSAWNPTEVGKMALPPCHCFMQFYVNNNKLSCQMYQRSADSFLGVPYNIASYALLTHMLAQVCDLDVGWFVHTFGDLHIYENHLDQVKEQMARKPYKLPTLKLNPTIKNIDDFTYDDIKLEGYMSHPTIKANLITGL